MVDAFLGRKYKLASSENFDEFMKAFGVGLITRKVGNTVSTTVELTKQGDEYIITSLSSLKNFSIRFKPGVEFAQETPDGRKVKAVITIDGNSLHEVQTDPKTGEIVTVVDRTYTADEAKTVMTAHNIVCTRIYKVVS